MPHIISKRGIEWNYDIEGEGSNLLFIHGWGVNKKIWRQQIKHFSKFYKVISIDLPGHGKSSWNKVNLTEMVEDLNGLLEELKIDVMTIVGSSLGGLVALKYYELFPEKIQRMVFVGVMPKFSKSNGYPHGLDIAKMRKLSGQLESDYPSIVNVFFRSLFTKEERQTRRFKWIQKFRRTDSIPMQHALLEYLDIMEMEDLRDVLKSVKVPLQFINGRDDEICDKNTVAFLQKSSPEARFDFFEKCGHFPFLTKAYEFNQIVETFLEESAT